MKEFLKIVIGVASLPQFAAALFFAYVTAFAMVMYRTTKRDVLDPRTPIQWSWATLWSDNSKHFIGNVIFIFLGVRFGENLLGGERTVYCGFIIGLIGDQLGRLFQVLADYYAKFVESKLPK
jgi:hypothetical protein